MLYDCISAFNIKAPIPEKIITNMEVMRVISRLLFLLTIFFVTTSLNVKKKADIIGRIKSKPNSKFCGFITIITPMKPSITADHLLIPTFSFKIKNEYTVTIKGAVINKV